MVLYKRKRVVSLQVKVSVLILFEKVLAIRVLRERLVKVDVEGEDVHQLMKEKVYLVFVVSVVVLYVVLV